jgi:hypothetical protein
VSDTAFSSQSLSLPVLVDESFSAFSCPAKVQKPSLSEIFEQHGGRMPRQRLRGRVGVAAHDVRHDGSVDYPKQFLALDWFALRFEFLRALLRGWLP